jgi:hypothetical protein
VTAHHRISPYKKGGTKLYVAINMCLHINLFPVRAGILNRYLTNVERNIEQKKRLINVESISVMNYIVA